MALFDQFGEQLERRSNIGRWQIVRVTFEDSNTDTIIRHQLPTPDPEQVSYQLLNATGPVSIYHDGTPSRLPWGNGFIRLRARVVPVTCDILLTVSAAPVGTTRIPQGASTTPNLDADTLDGLDSTAFARSNASFVTVSSEAGLDNESVLTAGSGISLTPGSGIITIAATGTGPSLPQVYAIASLRL